jgi:predicted TIM-barrel fold metal-dependent hydrolase
VTNANGSGLDLDWLISVDDHILEPPDVWVDRVPAKDRDRAPHMETDDNGLECWVYDGNRYPSSGLSAVAGKSKEEFSPEPLPYSEMRPGCYDPVARIEDMDRAGVLASLCFPTITRFCGQLFMEASDREFGLVCLKAYNDWMIEEWCGAAPGRYIPLVLIPMWDPQLAVAELERCAAKGATTFAFSENPAPLGLPTIHDPSRYWDPVLKAAADNEIVVCMHVGSSSQLPKISPDAPVLANMSWGSVRTAGAMLEWLFSGKFQEIPALKIALSEGSIGWIPYFLQRAEQVLNTQKYWAGRGVTFDPAGGTKGMGSNPEVDLDKIDIWNDYREHVYGCFIDDAAGIGLLDMVGEDNIMIETDYPHSDSTWPGSRKLAEQRIGHLPAGTQYKILRGNAERLYRFEPAAPPVAVPA